MKRLITDKELEQAYRQAAVIVAKYGETYLPIFDRLAKEIQKRKTKLDLLEKAIELANSSKNKPRI